MLKEVNEGKQIKIGAVFSYLLIVLNTVFGLFVSPFLLKQLGDGNYGVYKTIASFSSTLLVLDLGIGTTVMRYTAKFRAEKKYDAIGNFAAMGLIEAVIMGIVLLIVSLGIYFSIDVLYGNSFTSSEISLAKNIFLITILTMFLTIVDNVLNGVIMGTNQFAFANGFKFTTLLLRIVLTFGILYFWPNAVVLVSISFITTLLCCVGNFIYIVKKLKIRIKIIFWDKSIFKESLGYTALMFIQTLAVQANGNIDNIVIGAVLGSTVVAVYSFGIQMFNMYESLATSFSNLLLPKVSKKIAEGASDSELQDIVTKVGRIQFVVLGAALVGFICIGQDFISLWLGADYADVYYLTLILIIPVTFVLIENVCLSILRAKNLMRFRTISLIATAAFNAIFTIVGVILFNYYAAALGTALSTVFGSLIMMNIYYHKRIGFKVFKFYRDVTKRTAICAILPGILLVVLNKVLYGSWLEFFIKVVIYCAVYLLLLILYGFNKNEKQMLLGKLKRGREGNNG